MPWLLTGGRTPALLVLLCLTLFMAVFASQLRVELEPDSMVSSQPGQLATYDRFRDLFGNDEDLLLSVTHPQLLEPAGLAIIAGLTERLAGFAGVRHVLSLSNARQLVSGRYGAEDVPLLPDQASTEDLTAAVGTALGRNPQYEGLLISQDRRTAGLLVELDDHRGDVAQRHRLISQLRAMMNDLEGQAELHLTGVGVQKIDVADYVQRDQQVVLPLVVVVLAFMLAMIFRRPSGILLPLLATMVSLIWTMGFYALCGFELNTITSLLPPVVMVLAISNSIHLYNGWLHLDDDDSQRVEKIAAKVGELFLPCLFTALTTALGLVSLTISAVPAVRQFALFAAVGVLVSLLVSLTLVPIGLSFLPLPARHFRTGTGLLRVALQRIAALSVNSPRAIMLVALLLLVVTMFGLPRLKNNTDMVGFLRSDAPLAIDTSYIDRQLAGVNAIEYMIARKDGRALESPDDFSRLAKFEAFARSREPVANVYSILTLLRQVHRAETDGVLSQLPDDPDQLRYEFDLMAMAPDQFLQRRFLSPDRATARVSVWLHDIGSRKAADVVDELDVYGRALFGDGYRLTPTGSFYQLTQDSNRLVADMLKSFALSLSLVMLAILVLLRSPRLTLLAMIPNLIPILWTFGLMGYFGIDLSTGTAMIGAVVIGLAVDDTIHYLVHYRRVYAGVVSEAVTETTTRVGRALMIATLVLAFGFWVGCLGSFKPTIYFSFLVGGTLFGALICDLLVLPACLMLGCPTRREAVS